MEGTMKKQIEAEEYKLIVEKSPIMIWRSTVTMECDYFNEVWLNFTGRSLEQEIGNGWTEGVHPEDFDRCLQIYKATFWKEKYLKWNIDFAGLMVNTDGYLIVGYHILSYRENLKDILEVVSMLQNGLFHKIY